MQGGSDSIAQTLIDSGKYEIRYSDIDLEQLSNCLASYLLTNYLHKGAISIVGGAASGKTTLAQKLATRLFPMRAAVVCTDSYVIGTRSFRETYLTSDVPLAKYDFELFRHDVSALLRLEHGQYHVAPLYNPLTGSGVAKADNQQYGIESEQYFTQTFQGKFDYVIAEGDFQPLTNPLSIIYLHLSDRFRLQNRIRRDIDERAYGDVKTVAMSFIARQRLQHFPYTLPVMACADILIWSGPRLSRFGSGYRYSMWTLR